MPRKKVKPDLRLRDINELPAVSSTSTEELRQRARRMDRFHGGICALFGAVSMFILVAVIVLFLYLNGHMKFNGTPCIGDKCHGNEETANESHDEATVTPNKLTTPYVVELFEIHDEIIPLPTSLVPLYYDVFLAMTSVSDSVVTGKVTIGFMVVVSTKYIVLNVDRQVKASIPKYSEILCEGQTVTKFATDEFHMEYDVRAQTVTFTLNSELVSNSNCNLTIEVNTKVTTTMKGLFKITDVRNKIFGILPLAFNGRRLFPCFDDKNYRVKLNFEFTPPEGMNVLPIDIPYGVSGLHEIGMLVVPIEVVGTHRGINFHFFTSLSLFHIKSIFYKAYEFCNAYFGFSLPIKTIVVAAIPGLPGEDVSGKNFIFYNKLIEIDNDQLEKVAHRAMAKLWLINSFEIEDWGNQFLYEGLGEYVSQQRLERYSLQANIERANNLFEGLHYDLAGSTPIVITPGFRFKNEIEEFPLEISRKKASALFNLFAEIITPENFKTNLIAILNSCRKKRFTKPLSGLKFFQHFTAPPGILGPNSKPLDIMSDIYPMFVQKGAPALKHIKSQNSVKNEFVVDHPTLLLTNYHSPTFSVPFVRQFEIDKKVLEWTRRGAQTTMENSSILLDPILSGYYSMSYDSQPKLDTDDKNLPGSLRRVIDSIITNVLTPDDMISPMFRVFEFAFESPCIVHSFLKNALRDCIKLFEVIDEKRIRIVNSFFKKCNTRFDVMNECGYGRNHNLIRDQCHENYCANSVLLNSESVMRFVITYATSMDEAERHAAVKGINCLTNNTLIEGLLEKVFSKKFPKQYILTTFEVLAMNPNIRNQVHDYMISNMETVWKKIYDIHGLSSKSLEFLLSVSTNIDSFTERLTDVQMKQLITKVPGLVNLHVLTHRQDMRNHLLRILSEKEAFLKTYEYFASRVSEACTSSKIRLNCVYSKSSIVDVSKL